MSAPGRWGLVFLASPFRLTEEQKTGLALLAARAFLSEEGRATFDWERLHGELRATSEVRVVGSFVGQEFEAVLHSPEKSGKAVFLVAEKNIRAWGGVVGEA